jgi:glycosyltransferase involved in cell wall biosynthesis
MHTAIEIARLSGRRLTICGIIQDQRYFAEQVAPHIDGDRVVYLGSVGPQQRAAILGTSAALLHPIAFDEPFGLSVIESMACGTPMVAYPRGSMPEVIDDGVTGFLVHDAKQASDAVERITTIDRAGCRTRARQRFSLDRMVADYLHVYAMLLG